MAAKAILVLCASALFVQSAYSQCLGRGAAIGTGLGAPWGLAGTGLAGTGLVGTGLAGTGLIGAGLAYDGLAYGAGCGPAAPASSGGGFGVASASAIPPVGVSVASENVYEGALAVGGELPFLGTVALEGVLPTAGAGAVSYGCGNGAVGITEAGIGAGPLLAEGLAFGPGLAGGLGYAAGIAPGLGYRGMGTLGGCGCGAIY